MGPMLFELECDINGQWYVYLNDVCLGGECRSQRRAEDIVILECGSAGLDEEAEVELIIRNLKENTEESLICLVCELGY